MNGDFVLPAGGAEEQAAAATLFVLLCVQLGGGDEADECFKMLLPILTYILMDNSASMAARQSVSHRADRTILCPTVTSGKKTGWLVCVIKMSCGPQQKLNHQCACRRQRISYRHGRRLSPNRLHLLKHFLLLCVSISALELWGCAATSVPLTMER